MTLRWILGWCLAGCLALSACSTAVQVPTGGARLFDDARFSPPSDMLAADDVFAVSDAMRSYLRTDMAAQLHAKGPRDGLIDALYQRSQLQIAYDSTATRTAAQAFDARAGNCLSLVIMTAAFAKELGLAVHYHRVFVDEGWARSGGIYFSSGHVNLSLGLQLKDFASSRAGMDRLTVDFLPAADLAGQRSQEIGESTVVAMFMNNRAAEALAHGRVNDAYWWARQAIGHEPTFLNSYNTLGVVYLRHGDAALAQQVLERLLEREPGNTNALSNLVQALQAQGRTAEAQQLAQKLAQIEPYTPFHFFDLGVAAMRAGDYAAAKALFTKEVEREAYYHEFHFWLALAEFSLGEVTLARRQMALAIQSSTTPQDRELYAAKLDRIRSATRTQ